MDLQSTLTPLAKQRASHTVPSKIYMQFPTKRPQINIVPLVVNSLLHNNSKMLLLNAVWELFCNFCNIRVARREKHQTIPKNPLNIEFDSSN
jgi:hypothetical protein